MGNSNDLKPISDSTKGRAMRRLSMDRIKVKLYGSGKLLFTVTAGAFLMMTFVVLIGSVQRRLSTLGISRILTADISEFVTGVETNGAKMKDVFASPVFSQLSFLGKNLLGKGYPEIIEVDYDPISITKNMSVIDMQDALVALLLQRQIICPDWEIFGLKTDGGWPVCKAKILIPQRPCTVYSFGINYDWSFDDAYHDRYGCTIRTFDPSMGSTKEHEHSPGVYFYPIGLSDKTEMTKWSLKSYKDLLLQFQEQNVIIPYLKFDIESMEWAALTGMLRDGSLRNVIQLSFEVHVQNLKKVKEYFEIIKKLETLGFRRWFYHHRLNGFSFQCDQSYINMNLLKGKGLKFPR